MFPHSDICGSKLICSSPQLFAACHVLHRLLMPRHSPYALVHLNFLASSHHVSWIAWVSEHLFRFVNSFVKRFYPFALESFSTFRWNCNLPKLERPINSTSDLVKIICPLICSFLTLQYTLFGFQWSLFLLPYLFKSMMQRWCKNFAAQNFWWAQVDSNHRPRAYQARALTTWAMSPFSFSVYLVLSRRLCPLTLTYAR